MWVNSKPIEEVQKEHSSRLMSLPGAIGVGIGKAGNQPCIMVFVEKITTALQAAAPDHLDGYPVVLEESGKFDALN